MTSIALELDRLQYKTKTILKLTLSRSNVHEAILVAIPRLTLNTLNASCSNVNGIQDWTPNQT